MNNCQHSLDYLGLEIDDLLIDLAASIAEVMKADVNFAQLMPFGYRFLKESDVIIGDLPVGYYQMVPNCESLPGRFPSGPLPIILLIEQSLKCLKPGGVAIF